MPADELQFYHLLLTTHHSPLTTSPLLPRPFPAEHLDRWAGHVHVIVRFRPVQLQVAARQVGGDPPTAAPGQHSRHRHRTRPGAAGHRFPGTALPDAHRDLLRPVDADELHVRPPREGRVTLDLRAD